jgi:formylglycine-generating enzyme required for sulfatase activity
MTSFVRWVVRGGGWGGYVESCRAASRSYSGLGYSHYGLGFRCARGAR